jgi:hypothetical protein
MKQKHKQAERQFVSNKKTKYHDKNEFCCDVVLTRLENTKNKGGNKEL